MADKKLTESGSSSTTFLAFPGLVDAAQFLTILSIGLSLCSIMMGINGVVDEKLSGLQHELPTITGYVLELLDAGCNALRRDPPQV